MAKSKLRNIKVVNCGFEFDFCSFIIILGGQGRVSKLVSFFQVVVVVTVLLKQKQQQQQ